MRFRHGILLLWLVSSIVARAQSSSRMALVHRWDNDAGPTLGSQQYNDVYGWYDGVKQREYAILCGIDSIYFFDVTQPEQPVLCATQAGKSTGCRNRSVLTYGHYAYAVADQGNSSLQVFDLRYLPDSVSKVYDSDSLCIRAHTIVVDTFSARLYLCHNKRRHPQNGQLIMEALTILSVQQPEQPVYLGTLQPPVSEGTPLFDFVHDAAAYRDTVFCSTGSSGLFIYDLGNVLQPVIIRAITEYPEKGFNHSPAYDPQRKLLSFTDESAGTAVKLYSTSNFTSWQQRSLFRSSTGALAHKSYFKGDTLWVAYYHDGVWVFDVRNPDQVQPLAWYDTFEQTDYNGILGCWGVYPYLPSGIVLASDMSNGLFILRPDTTIGIKEKLIDKTIKLYPNPAAVELTVKLGILAPQTRSIKLFSRWGETLYTSNGPFNNIHSIAVNQLAQGMYMVFIEGENFSKALHLAIIR